MKFNNVLVIGGSGFIGRHLIAALVGRMVKVTLVTRSRERAKHLILLPTIDVVEADVFAPGVLARLLAGKDAVINLAGILHGRRGRKDERGPNDYGPDFARVHVELPQAIIAACRAAGVKRVLHISALGAAPDAPSEYLRSKGIGEKAVLAADDLHVTVFRPSVVFGPEDRFLNQFADLAKIAPVLMVPSPGARFQPVYVGDVARAMISALTEPETYGQRIELCGPRVYTMKELIEYVLKVTRRRRIAIGLSDRMSYWMARILEWSPGPMMTRDNYYSMQLANVCSGENPLPFGFVPQPLEATAPTYLAPLNPRERYPQLRWKARR